MLHNQWSIEQAEQTLLVVVSAATGVARTGAHGYPVAKQGSHAAAAGAWKRVRLLFFRICHGDGFDEERAVIHVQSNVLPGPSLTLGVHQLALIRAKHRALVVGVHCALVSVLVDGIIASDVQWAYLYSAIWSIIIAN